MAPHDHDGLIADDYVAHTGDCDGPAEDDYETRRLGELDWRYTSTSIEDSPSVPRIGEVCRAAIIALAHAYQPIEYGYNDHFLAPDLNDDFGYDTLGRCITEAHERELPNLPLHILRLVDRILATYESVMVDGAVVHAALAAMDDDRSRWAVEASISLRCRRMLREVERQLHVDGHVTAAEAALEYVARLHGTPLPLLHSAYV